LVIFFFLLEGLAFSWIFSSRSFQRSTYLNSSRALTGEVLAQYDGLTDYLHLKEQNQNLLRENARLRSLQEGAYFSVSPNTRTANDTTYKVRYQYLEAEVINSSFLKRQNYITLNRGTAHGLKPQMGVIGPLGAVGEVKDVGEHFATVIPLINPSLAISGRLKGTGFFGPVHWDGTDYTRATVSDIPRYAKVEKGDSIITDARSLIFPPGILIGTIEEYSIQDDKNFYILTIKLATDFASVNEVYVVTDKMKTEILQLQSTP
jgi:rod shape-determining protein MreC